MDIPQRFNIGAELVERNLREGRGSSPAVWFANKTLSYDDVAQLTGRISAALLRAGVRPEQRVLFILPDCPELLAGYLAAMKIGAVAVPCNSLLRADDYAYFMEESRASVLVTAQGVLQKLSPVLSSQRHLTHVLVTGLAEERGLLRSFERFVEETPAGAPETAVTRADEPAFWLWTSGSTGKPKAAVHAHQDWPHCCELYARKVLGLSERDRCFSASKLFHAYGLGNALAFPFWVGASTALVPDRPAPDLVYRVIGEARS